MVKFRNFHAQIGALVFLTFLALVTVAGAANPTRSPSFFLGTADAG
jgi:hypothetical protein